MFAAKATQPQKKAAGRSTGGLLPHRPTLVRYRTDHALVEQGSSASTPDHPHWNLSQIPAFPPQRPGLPQPLSVRGAQTEFIQPKLAIGAVDDPLEREADALADRVMRMPRAASSISPAQEQISRKCSACEKEEEQQTLRTKPAAAAMRNATAPQIVHEVLRTPGQPLTTESRAFFEPRFGFDFGKVRVHHDAAATGAAHAVAARAYTVGNHVVFAAGQFEPATDSGRALLAHELAHVLQQQSPRGLQRQVARPGTAKDQREFVRDTIQFLEQSAAAFQLAEVDHATFDRVISSWYSMVARQEEIITSDLHGDATLKADLRAAYISALRVLVQRHAATSKLSETDLYRINSGRIPLWAQPHPNHLEPGVSTPIPDEEPITRSGANFQFSLNGFNVVIRPDTRVRAQEKPGITHLEFSWPLEYQWGGARGHMKVVSFTVPAPTVTIFTTYLRGVNTAEASGYGRGTTAEDKAGAQVIPASQSLAFHESRHGQAMLDFIRSNPPPPFTGQVGDTVAAFKKAIAQRSRDAKAYEKRLNKVDISQVHCVGITVDEFEAAAARGRRRRRSVKQCP